MNYDVVIVAAGSGSRMNLGYNKVYYRLEEKTILEHAILLFEEDPSCKKIIVVTDVETYQKEVGDRYPKVTCVMGGETRQESVWKGLEEVESEYVFIHDGARPYLTKEVVHRLESALESHNAVCPMVPVKDTIKVVQDHIVQNTLVRKELYAAQTPQAFQTALLRECLKKANEEGKVLYDDCMAVEQYSNEKVFVVEGDYRNKKITTIDDLN